MSWAVGFDTTWHRDIGYGVPAFCDQPGCPAQIDRGLGCVCGGQPYGGDVGCGLHFCGDHLYHDGDTSADGQVFWSPQLCDRCVSAWPNIEDVKTFDATNDTPEWLRHKLSDDSWQKWRTENPQEALTHLIRLYLYQGEGNDHGEPREVYQHVAQCRYVVISDTQVEHEITHDERRAIDVSHVRITATVTCPHQSDPSSFSYSDFGTLETLYDAVEPVIEEDDIDGDG